VKAKQQCNQHVLIKEIAFAVKLVGDTDEAAACVFDWSKSIARMSGAQTSQVKLCMPKLRDLVTNLTQ
jgi:hypothetical protein